VPLAVCPPSHQGREDAVRDQTQLAQLAVWGGISASPPEADGCKCELQGLEIASCTDCAVRAVMPEEEVGETAFLYYFFGVSLASEQQVGGSPRAGGAHAAPV